MCKLHVLVIQDNRKKKKKILVGKIGSQQVQTHRVDFCKAEEVSAATC